jgi:hypothetical protein
MLERVIIDRDKQETWWVAVSSGGFCRAEQPRHCSLSNVTCTSRSKKMIDRMTKWELNAEFEINCKSVCMAIHTLLSSMDDLRRRLLRVEQDFLSAFNEGDEAIAAFEESWSALIAEISPLASDDETRHLIHATASNLTVLTEALLDLDQEYDAMSSSLNTEVLEIFESMNLTESKELYPGQRIWQVSTRRDN